MDDRRDLETLARRARRAEGRLVVLVKLKQGVAAVGSALLPVGACALLWGWRFAVGFVALLAVHEAPSSAASPAWCRSRSGGPAAARSSRRSPSPASP